MKHLLAVLCALLAFAIMCGFVKAYSETIELPARDSRTRDVSISQGDKVSGHISIVGQTINFSISDPDNTVTLSDTITDPQDFQFTAEKTGTYTFHFENLYSDGPEFVTLNYNVQRYIFGFPQEFIILFAIVGVALIGIVVFMAMSPKP